MPVMDARNDSVEAKELDLVRVFDAPRELVWKAWTEPKHLAQWWGPHGFSNPVCEVDLRPGGAYRIDMKGPDGTIYPSNGVIREVVPPSRLAFTSGLEPLFEVLTTVTLSEQHGKTTVKLNARVLRATEEAAPYLAGMEAGWSQSLERLGEIATPTADREIFATRLFEAPRELVFRMWTDRNHVQRWWGPNGFTNTIYEMDVRPGGVWHFVMHGPDGRDYINRIVYVEIKEPERIVYDHVSGPLFHVTVNFEQQGKYTKVSMHGLFESAELRDRTVKEFGAIEGMHQHLGRLAEEVQKMAGNQGEVFVISRTFDAPRDLVWRAWTEPDRLAQWFGPKGTKIIHSQNDLRPGGTYHYGMRNPDGKEVWGKWIYREVLRPQRLVFIGSFSDEKGGMSRHPLSRTWPLELMSTITFAEDRGKTTITIRWEPYNANQEERKTFAAAQASMNQGWSGTFEQLEAYLAKARTA